MSDQHHDGPIIDEHVKRQEVDAVLLRLIVARAQASTGRFRDPTIAAFETVMEGWVSEVVNPHIRWVLSQPSALTGHKADVAPRFQGLFGNHNLVRKGVRRLVAAAYPAPTSEAERKRRVNGCMKVIVALLSVRELRGRLSPGIGHELRAVTEVRGPWPTLNQVRQRIAA
jgi:hypothetical protein